MMNCRLGSAGGLQVWFLSFLESAVEKKATDLKKNEVARKKEQTKKLRGEAALSWKGTLEIIARCCQEPCLT